MMKRILLFTGILFMLSYSASAQFSNGGTATDYTMGKVGIGTSSPTAVFQVYSTSSHLARFYYNDNSSSGTRPRLDVWGTPNKINLRTTYGSGGAHLSLGTHNVHDALYISHSGLIGIGTTSPRANLEINNEVGYNTGMSATGQDHLLLSAPSPGKDNYFGGITWSSSGRRRASIAAVLEDEDTDYVGIAFFTQGTDGPGDFYESMRISKDGNVGIGTTSPKANLEINNEVGYNTGMSATGQDHILLSAPSPGKDNYFGGMTWSSSGRRRASIAAVLEDEDTDYVGIAFFTQGTDGPGDFYESMRISKDGNVGIGTNLISNPKNYKLAVNGTIGAKQIEVEVSSATWSDFVFDESYKLRSLNEVAEYINENKHLPDIPSAEEVGENGVNLGEMDAKLLQKIEELTLYIIEQQKTIDAMSKRMEEMETK